MPKSSAPWSGAQHDDVLGAGLAFPAGLSPSQGYARLVAAGKLTSDEHQAGALAALDSLYRELVQSSSGGGSAAARRPPPGAEPVSSGGIFGAMFASLSGGRSGGGGAPRSSGGATQGLYLWGGTGCGKTMLMDVFYRALPVGGGSVPKLRVHFHAFMLGVHARLHVLRQGGQRGDPLVALAEEIASSGGGGGLVMCFDELQVTDVGDALMMRRLFDGLWARGVTVVATSNRPPEELYAAGLQRELFLPFVAQLKARSRVLPLVSPTDYRKLAGATASGSGGGGVWLCPETVGGGDDTAVAAAFATAWQAAVRGSELQALTLAAQGRAVPVPLASRAARAARFTFDELCGAPLYSADYQALARSFRTLFVERVPALTLSERNEVRRFITLVDTMYEHRVVLVVGAAASPLRLFSPVWREAAAAVTAAPAAAVAPPAPDAAAPDVRASKYDEAFAFDRTVSRLLEMQSAGYLAGEWRPHVSGGTPSAREVE